MGLQIVGVDVLRIGAPLGSMAFRIRLKDFCFGRQVAVYRDQRGQTRVQLESDGLDGQNPVSPDWGAHVCRA
jgi:hypothetical protein